MKTTAEAYPLDWPEGWPRHKPFRRQRARYKVLLGVARDHLLAELRRFNARHVVISSNLPVKQDGLPYARAAEPRADPGVAVYFTLKNEQQVIACDCWDRVKDNLRAIGLTVAAMRQIERSGATDLLRRAFQGFKALPPPEKPPTPWWEVLGVPANAERLVVEAVYKARARVSHPDNGGSEEAMKELNRAYEEACEVRP